MKFTQKGDSFWLLLLQKLGLSYVVGEYFGVNLVVFM